MEYFEIEKDIKDKNKKINKDIYKRKYFFGIFIILLLALFFIVININDKKQNQNLTPKENIGNKKLPKVDNNSIETNKAKINLESIKESPHLHTQYIFNILNNYDKLDLTIFIKNIKTVKYKILSVVNNKEDFKDLYVILSTIYGAFLGDSMGSFCEFKSFNKNNHLSIFDSNSNSIFKPGQVTDDSEMAMSQAYSIMDNSDYNSLNEHIIFYYYLIWYNSHPLDIGITTIKALSSLQLDNNVNITNKIIFSEKIKDIVKKSNSGSLANGLLMRISPILAWFYMVNKEYIKNILEAKTTEKYYELYNKIFIEIQKDSQLTHPNRENAVAGSIFIFMGLCAMEQKYTGKQILNILNILFYHDDFDLKKEESILKNHFIKTIKDFEKSDFEKNKYFGDLRNLMGYYLHAFKLTLYYLYNYENMKNEKNIKDIYNDIMFNICDFGGDTDTNAAIVGMIIGPLIGLENFNNKYFDTFLNFYSKKRLIYTNVFMYFYATYLIDISNKPNSTPLNNNNKINFNFYLMLENMLNKEL